jgi:hypothetical protein
MFDEDIIVKISKSQASIFQSAHFLLFLNKDHILFQCVLLCDILIQSFNMIDRIFISPSYTFFFRKSTSKKFRVKRACPSVISGWMTDQKCFSSA